MIDNKRLRFWSLLLGTVMFATSLYLVLTVHVSLAVIFYTFNPYPFYFIGLFLGIERIFYGITGNRRLYYLLMGEGEFYSMSMYALFITFLFFGIYIGVYAFFFNGLLVKLMDIINGLTYIVFSLMLIL